MTGIDVDALPDAVIVLDHLGGLVAANAAADELFGSLTETIGHDFIDAREVRTPLGDPAFATGWPAPGTDIEVAVRHRDGSDVQVTVTSAEHDGSRVLCARPVSDRSGIAIVSTVSHELRSPLTSVKGYVSLLLSRWDRIDDDKKREMLAQVHHDADRVTRLVTELLDISRLETGRLVLRRQMVDLGDMARTVVDKVKMAYPQLDCEVTVDDEIPEVYADPDKIEQVFTNLVENAAKYGNPLGMTVELARSNGFVHISVTDKGEGMPAQDIARVFEKFFRADHGRPTGTGLGLWISRGLVEAHEGSLKATSVVGEGSTFTFTLPDDAFARLHGD